jgi:hypothetical protein
MRAFMIVAFASMLFLSGWANYADSADAVQPRAASTTAEPGY